MPTFWNSSKHSQVAADMLVFKDGCGIGERNKLLEVTMETKPDWEGAMVSVPCDLKDVRSRPMIIYPDHPEELGSAPWAFCVRAHARRCGPTAWPLLGFGCFVCRTRPSALDLSILCMPTSGIIAQGVVLKGIPSFLEADSGKVHLEKHSFVLTLTGECDVVWAPWGHIAVAVSSVNEFGSDDSQEKEKENGKEGEKDGEKDDAKSSAASAAVDAQVSYLWGWAPFSKNAASQLDDQTWMALRTWNADFIKRNESQVAWAQRGKTFNSFAEAVVRSA